MDFFEFTEKKIIRASRDLFSKKVEGNPDGMFCQNKINR